MIIILVGKQLRGISITVPTEEQPSADHLTRRPALKPFLPP